MFDRQHIGHVFPSHVVEVEKGAVRLFAKAIGETDPVYFDESAARTAGYRGLAAPLTYAYALEGLSPNPWPIAGLLGFAQEQSIHAEQAFEYFQPLCAGDQLTLTERIVDMYDKKNGDLEFVVTRTDVTNERNELVLRMTSTVVIIERNKPS